MALAADEFVFWSGVSMCWARSGPSYGYSIGLEYVEYVGGFSSSYSQAVPVFIGGGSYCTTGRHSCQSTISKERCVVYVIIYR